MLFRLLADMTVMVHFFFIIFVVIGGWLAWRWRPIIWFHLPAVTWAVVIEFFGFLCPLTPLENRFRLKGGEAGYPGGFIEHYIIPVIYPSGLTRGAQIILGTAVITINLFFYAVIIIRARSKSI